MTSALLLTLALAASPPTDSVDGGSQPSAAQAPTDQSDATAATKPAPDVSKLPFNRTSIAAVMAYNQEKVQSCYEETLASREKAVQGKVATSFIITPEGLVKKPRVERKGTTLKDKKLDDCIIGVLASMTFPKPPDKRNHPIQYPFNLKAVR